MSLYVEELARQLAIREQQNAAAAAWKYVQWHDWFAWRPVRSSLTGRLAWLRTVRRRWDYGSEGWQYQVYRF